MNIYYYNRFTDALNKLNPKIEKTDWYYERKLAKQLWNKGVNDYTLIAHAVLLKRVMNKRGDTATNEEYLFGVKLIQELPKSRIYNRIACGALLIKNLKGTLANVDVIANHIKRNNLLLDEIIKGCRVAVLSETSFHELMLKGWMNENPRITNCEYISAGRWGIVYKVSIIGEITLQNKIAMKINSSEPEAERELLSEIACLQKLHASKLISKEEKQKIIQAPTPIKYFKNTGYLTKLMSGDLSKYNNLNLQQKIAIAKQLIEQMAILAKAGVIYTDISFKNVLVDDTTNPPTVYLSDFGNCHFIDDPKTVLETGFTLSPYYTMAKDRDHLIKALANPNKLQHASQIHASRALGLLLHHLFTNLYFEPSGRYYKMQSIKELFNNYPLSDLLRANRRLHNTIIGMIGLDDSLLIKPEKAWARIKD